jgi:hypothetical protein
MTIFETTTDAPTTTTSHDAVKTDGRKRGENRIFSPPTVSRRRGDGRLT